MPRFAGSPNTKRKVIRQVHAGGAKRTILTVLLVMGCFAESWAAISLEANVSKDNTSASTSISTPSFSTNSGNELLLAFIATDYMSGANIKVNSVAGGGLTWILVNRTNAQSGTAEIWRAFAPTPLSNVSVLATLSQSVVASITLVSYTGVDTTGTNGSGAIGATGSGNANNGAPKASLTTTRNNSWVFGVGNDYDNAISRTPGSGQTLVHQFLAPVGDTYWVQMQNVPTPASGTPVTINDTAPTGDRYNLSIVEVLPAQGAVYSVSGSIAPPSLGSGATVTLSQNGNTIATVTADGSGNFSFSNVQNGTYTVTPSMNQVGFTPVSQTVTVNGASVTGVAFTATSQSWSISGTVTPATAGIAVSLSGTSNGSTTTNSSGSYTFSGLVSGSYSVTPTQAGYIFGPLSKSVIISGANVTGVNFTATAKTWSISGTITPATAGITVTLSGTSNGSTSTDTSGNYSIGGLVNGNYTVTPTRTGYAFTPTSLNATVNGANVSGQNFSWQSAGTGIAIDANVSTDGASASTTIATPTFSTSSTNELLLAFVATDYISGSNTSVNGISGGGLTWTLVNRTNVQSGTGEIWRAFAPTPLSNVSVMATLTQRVVASITVLSYTGVDNTGTNGSGAIGATGSGNGRSGAPTASLTTTRNNSWVFGVGNDHDSAISRTPGSGQTLVHQFLAPIGDTYWVQMQNAPTLASGTPVTISDTAPTGDRYNLSIVEVLPLLSGPLYTISGTINPAASGAGTLLTLNGAAYGTATADSLGNYSFAGLMNGVYAVTPSKTGYTFNPATRAVTVIGGNVSGVNFTATAVTTWSLSGTIAPATSGTGTLITLSGTKNSTATADSSGNYSFTNLSNGSYTVTPSKAGYTFSPVSQAIVVNGANVSGANFTASGGGNVIFYDNFTQSSLGPAWTVISRHGEYAQSETECNTSQQVASGSGLTITTAAQSWSCGDFNIDGSTRHAPSNWPYITGDIQWTSQNFTYGTVEVRAKFPPQATSLWPATWLLGANCQLTNIYTADTGYYTCPALGNTGYVEIDMTECYGSGWCQFHVANPAFGIGGGCDAVYPVDNNWHIFTTVWTSTSIKQYMDGVLKTTCNQRINSPMFLIIQTQTGGVGGNPNNGLLPAQLLVDYVKVTQP